MPNSMPDATTLRLLWSILETLHPTLVIEYDATVLVQRVMQDVNRQIWLDPAESTRVNLYLTTKLPLIRNLAEQRLLG